MPVGMSPPLSALGEEWKEAQKGDEDLRLLIQYVRSAKLSNAVNRSLEKYYTIASATATPPCA